MNEDSLQLKFNCLPIPVCIWFVLASVICTSYHINPGQEIVFSDETCLKMAQLNGLAQFPSGAVGQGNIFV